ncbi:DUF2231 domain-containing protein [Novosphingobium cyanobacteriorum]|uniref:DUF2231 domain-containing protein n=1 Tax=Novosphingobium cyanobacteriorum TaxID=3024215 RepID=A0ABT6CJQ8_9SPHN|nr:DUF2231 domain-containing protein [Novosphingobium cyanobacteriorum]MDF8333803.1 hypothetical protein [Novosphingobium cyanobacteriorum]
MVVVQAGRPAPVLHPLQAALVAGIAPLFIGALLCDLAYGSTAEPQWSNFAAWLLAGGMVYAGFALLWALIDLVRLRTTRGRAGLLALALLALFVFGLVDCFVHARDAWAIMPDGPILSAVVAVLSLIALALSLSLLRRERVA